jgi:hypothetical protein
MNFNWHIFVCHIFMNCLFPILSCLCVTWSRVLVTWTQSITLCVFFSQSNNWCVFWILSPSMSCISGYIYPTQFLIWSYLFIDGNLNWIFGLPFRMIVVLSENPTSNDIWPVDRLIRDAPLGI